MKVGEVQLEGGWGSELTNSFQLESSKNLTAWKNKMTIIS